MAEITLEQLAEWKRLAEESEEEPFSFYVAARTALPMLLARVEELEAMVKVYNLQLNLRRDECAELEQEVARLREALVKAVNTAMGITVEEGKDWVSLAIYRWRDEILSWALAGKEESA